MVKTKFQASMRLVHGMHARVAVHLSSGVVRMAHPLSLTHDVNGAIQQALSPALVCGAVCIWKRKRIKLLMSSTCKTILKQQNDVIFKSSNQIKILLHYCVPCDECFKTRPHLSIFGWFFFSKATWLKKCFKFIITFL